MEFEIKNICKRFGRKVPLLDASFTAKSGECIGIIGKNGSGKSTLLSILAGVQKADRGNFLCDGEDLFSSPAQLAKILGYVPQGTPLFDELSAKDNLRLWYGSRELKKELSDGVLSMLGIDEFITVPVKKMSGGMKKRLSIGCSMANKPKILLLDEPSAALDIVCKQSIVEYLTKFKESGGTVVITTHDESELAMCDRIYLLKDSTLSPYEYDGNVSHLAEMLK